MKNIIYPMPQPLRGAPPMLRSLEPAPATAHADVTKFARTIEKERGQIL